VFIFSSIILANPSHHIIPNFHNFSAQKKQPSQLSLFWQQ